MLDELIEPRPAGLFPTFTDALRVSWPGDKGVPASLAGHLDALAGDA